MSNSITLNSDSIMYKRVGKTIEVINTLIEHVILSNHSNFVIIQSSMFINQILELCKMFYIEIHKPQYSEPICKYTNSTGQFPKMRETVEYTVSRLGISTSNSSITRAISARNECVHNTEKFFDKLEQSVFFLYTDTDFLFDIYSRVSELHGYTISKDLFYMICAYSYYCVNNKSQSYHSILATKKDYTEQDINLRLNLLTFSLGMLDSILNSTEEEEEEANNVDSQQGLDSSTIIPKPTALHFGVTSPKAISK